MKKFFYFLTFVLFSTTLSFANDILFKASKAVLNENSPSVKKLSDAEMAEIRGGLRFYRFYMDNGAYINEFGVIDKNTRRLLSYSASYKIALDEREIFYQSLDGYAPGTGRTNYMIFNSFANGADEIPVLTLSYTWSGNSGSVRSSFGVLNTRTGAHRPINDPLAYGIMFEHREQLIYQEFIAKDIPRYLRTRR